MNNTFGVFKKSNSGFRSASRQRSYIKLMPMFRLAYVFSGFLSYQFASYLVNAMIFFTKYFFQDEKYLGM